MNELNLIQFNYHCDQSSRHLVPQICLLVVTSTCALTIHNIQIWLQSCILNACVRTFTVFNSPCERSLFWEQSEWVKVCEYALSLHFQKSMRYVNESFQLSQMSPWILWACVRCLETVHEIVRMSVIAVLRAPWNAWVYILCFKQSMEHVYVGALWSVPM